MTTAQEMQDKFDTAMGILMSLAYEENFNDHVKVYELGMSFDEFVADMHGKVAFTEMRAASLRS